MTGTIEGRAAKNESMLGAILTVGFRDREKCRQFGTGRIEFKSAIKNSFSNIGTVTFRGLARTYEIVGKGNGPGAAVSCIPVSTVCNLGFAVARIRAALDGCPAKPG